MRNTWQHTLELLVHWLTLACDIHWNQERIYYNTLLTSTGIHWQSDIHGLLGMQHTLEYLECLVDTGMWQKVESTICWHTLYLILHRPGEIEGERDQSLNPPPHLERRGAKPSFLNVYNALHYKGNFKISDDTVGRVLSVSQNFSREYASRPL